MDSVRSGAAETSRANCVLSPEGAAALYAALEDRSTTRDLASSAATVDAVRRICDEAKREHWPPESLLIAFKKALAAAPAVRRLTRGPKRDAFVARLVSLCIAEYYRDVRR
ncbi:MAG TPA: hypothetical protein VGH98_05935 [Gemmatimonadaceae bacterium]|jgi:hypothetical protein